MKKNLKMKNNICEIGIDIVNKIHFINSPIHFIKRFLTNNEYLEYLQVEKEYKVNFLSGRWAAKEAIYKAISKFKKINLLNIEILYDENKRAFCSNIDNISLSISHTDNYSIAIAIVKF